MSPLKNNKDKIRNFVGTMDSLAMSTATTVLILRRVRDLAAVKRYTNLRQMTLDSYFQ